MCRLLPFALILGCSGDDTATATATPTDTDSPADTDTVLGDTDTDLPLDTGTVPPPGGLILPCQDLAFTVACYGMSSGFATCSDYFGANSPELIGPQCVSGGGTLSETPCVLPDRVGTCIYYNAGLPDYCYMTHIAGEGAVAFWESTCPAVGGMWQPAP
jgi:hypothetical protein